MRIQFKKIKFQNLLSYGEPTEFNFQNGIDLIIGKNGRGKSTIPDAITFALFGKPFRKIKIGGLVNNKTKKKMICELDFDIIKSNKVISYKIIRGLCPQKFEIYIKNEEGEFVNIDQHSTTRDYQKFLEDEILKINDNVFRQLIVLGANLSSSKSFMDLNSKEKEEILQVITDTSIFIQLADMIREKKNILKTELQTLKNQIDNEKNSLKNTEDNIAAMEKQKKDFLENRNLLIGTLENQIKDIDLSLEESIKKLGEPDISFPENKIKESQQQLDKLIKAKNKLESDINLNNYKIKHYIQNEKNKIICPECGCEIKEKLDFDFDNTTKENERLKEKLEKINNLINSNTLELESQKKYLRELDNYILNLEISIKNFKENKKNLEKQINDANTWEPPEIDYNILENLKRNYEELKKKYISLETDANEYVELENLLGEESLKGLILNQQLPILNKFINEFLELFESKYNFIIDKSLKDTIVSRGSEAEFNALSNGQKQRITIAILFSFLRLIEEKNGVSTNLLILDEYLDSSLDELGVSEVLKILFDKFSTNKNILLISHNPDVKSKIEFIKRNFLVKFENGFSKLEEIIL